MGTGRLRLAVVDGDIDNGSVMAGQVAAMVNEKTTVKEILESMMKGLDEAKEDLDKRMSKLEIINLNKNRIRNLYCTQNLR